MAAAVVRIYGNAIQKCACDSLIPVLSQAKGAYMRIGYMGLSWHYNKFHAQIARINHLIFSFIE